MKIETIYSDVYGDSIRPSTKGAAAIDLRANLNEDEIVVLDPGDWVKINTGVSFHIKDESVAALALPRSGLAGRGVTLTNGVGLIDSDYQGPVYIGLVNRGRESITIERGDRIAQIVFINILAPNLTEWVRVDEFSESSDRGEGGYGSTGVKSNG